MRAETRCPAPLHRTRLSEWLQLARLRLTWALADCPLPASVNDTDDDAPSDDDLDEQNPVRAQPASDPLCL